MSGFEKRRLSFGSKCLFLLLLEEEDEGTQKKGGKIKNDHVDFFFNFIVFVKKFWFIYLFNP